MKKSVFLLIAVLALTSGCATMNESECLTADWYSVGYEDGRGGINESRMGTYRKDCAKHGVTPSLESYRKGHYEGSKQFCTARNGFTRGKSGSSYSGSCPADLEDDFMKGYSDGKTLYGLRVEINELQAKIDSAHEAISDNESLILEKRDMLIADGVPATERIGLLADMDTLKDENESIEAEVMFLESKLLDLEDAYGEAERKLSIY